MAGIVFGKLPAHGDFVSRGIAAADRDRLDAWLSASLAEARQALGTAFEARYDQALPWQGRGEGVTGAIAASQDAAGRRFPLLVLTAGTDAAACEEWLYQAIGEGWSVDRLAEELPAIPDAPLDRWLGPNGRALQGAEPPALLTAMLA